MEKRESILSDNNGQLKPDTKGKENHNSEAFLPAAFSQRILIHAPADEGSFAKKGPHMYIKFEQYVFITHESDLDALNTIL